MTDIATAVLILGAGPRLGGAIARRFGRDGRALGLVSHSEPAVTELAGALRSEGIDAHAASADAGDADALRTAVQRLAGEVGEFGVAVHNVSVWRDAGALVLTPQALFSDLAVGAASLLTLTQAVAPAMISRGGGTILATGSAAADVPSPGAPSLGVQKAALRVLTKAMAGELAPKGIHCATVTINGVLGTDGFDPTRIAGVYADLVAETSGPGESWRTVVTYDR